MGAEWLFVPHGTSEESRRKNREKVAKHIGKHFRNRSKPLQEHRQAQGEAVSHNTSCVDSDPRTSVPVLPRRPGEVFGNSIKKQSITIPLHLHTESPDDSETGQRATTSWPEERHIDTSTSNHHPLSKSVYVIPGKQTIQPPLRLFHLSDQHSQWASFAFDFQINFIFPRVANWGRGPNIYSSTFAQMMMQDQLLFDAVAASAHGWHSLEVEHNAQPSLPVLWYRNRALRGLHSRLTLADTSELSVIVLVIFYMLENAARLGQTKDFRLHHAGLLQLRGLRGSRNPSSVADMFAEQAIVILESSEMASTGRIFQKSGGRRLQYPELPLHSPIRDAALALPFGLKRLAMEGCLSTSVIENLCAIPTANYWHKDLAASQRHSMIVQRLRALGQSSTLPVEKLVCLGAVAFSLRLVVHMHLLPEMGFLQRILKAGQRVQRGSEQLHRELNVWALTIAADLAASTNVELREQAQRVLIDLRTQESYWLGSWVDVENALKKFFYSESFSVGWRERWQASLVSG